MKRKVYNSARAKGEVHDMLRKKGPRFSVENMKIKDHPRNQKHKRSNTVYKSW